MKEYLERVSSAWTKDSIRFINTSSQAVRQKFFYIQEIGYFMTSPPYFTERENLDSYLLVYTISGKGILEYNNRKYVIYPGQAFYISCMSYHHYACMEDSTWEMLWVHFNGETARGYYEEFIRTGFFPVKFKDTFFIESTMRRLLSLTQKKDIHSEIISSNLIINILTQLIILNSAESLALSYMPNYLKTTLKELETHFLEPFSLEKIAFKVGISKFHLTREFKKYMDVTMNEYIITLRLNHAKELLRYSHQSIAEIAYASGMNNVSHFINLFKSREALTPLQYRKEWNENE